VYLFKGIPPLTGFLMGVSTVHMVEKEEWELVHGTRVPCIFNSFSPGSCFILFCT